MPRAGEAKEKLGHAKDKLDDVFDAAKDKLGHAKDKVEDVIDKTKETRRK